MYPSGSEFNPQLFNTSQLSFHISRFLKGLFVLFQNCIFPHFPTWTILSSCTLCIGPEFHLLQGISRSLWKHKSTL